MIVKYDDKERAVYLDEPLTKEIARTIKYEPPIKCKLPIVQKAVFHRTATVDDETYCVEEYSEWEAENNTWDKVEIDEEEGYDVSPKVVESKEVNADSENETVLVKYEEVFEKVEMNRDKAYAKRKQKPPLPPAEGNKETERTENGETSKETEGIKNDEERKETEKNEEVKDFKGIEIKRDAPYAKRKQKPPLPPAEGNKETEEVENVKEPKETEKNEEVKDFKGIEIKRYEPYAKRKKKPPLPPTKENEKSEETENVEKPKEEKSGESSGLDALSSEFKENMLKRIVKKEESEPVDEEKKTDSKTLPSAKESSLSKAKQSIISKTNEKNRQKEAFRNYQQQKYHEKMNGCVRNVRVQKPIQINDIGRFSAETIDFLNELKEIGEEALTREKWKVTLFAK